MQNKILLLKVQYATVINGPFGTRSFPLRIMRASAAKRRENIRSMSYQSEEYGPPYSTFENVTSVVTDSLIVFLKNVINKQKKNTKVCGY